MMPSGSDVGVMLVDDHAIVREGYRRLLESEPGIRVVAECDDAQSAQASLENLPSGMVQVVVLDLAMPGSGGLALARRIGQRWPALRVLVSACTTSRPSLRRHSMPVLPGYITKTSAPQDLVQALRRVAQGQANVLSPDIERRAVLPEAHAPHMLLSPREFDVLQGLVEGATLELIAQRLCISPKTVSNLQTRIRAKLGVSTPIELLRYAQQHRLVPT